MSTVSQAIRRATGLEPEASSEAAGWRHAAAFLWRGTAEEFDVPALGDAMTVLHVGGSRAVRVRVGARWTPERSRPGLVTVVPAGTPVRWQVPGGAVHSLTVHLSPERSRELLEDDPASEHGFGRIRLRFAELDPLLVSVTTALADELASPGECGSLYADALTDAILLHLLRDGSRESRLPGGLSPRALRRACDRIEEAIEHGVSLSVLALETGLSRFHFTRAFRRSTGRTPHQYLTERRIARARALLTGSELPIAEVAVACGFASQSHLGERFRRATGLSPLAYRLETRPASPRAIS